jgi:hypothetical protein
MWNPFKHKPLLGDDDQLFQIECYKWLLKHFGGDAFYNEAKLVIPTKEFFPAIVGSREETAAATFEQVKNHAGLGDWPCRLEAQEEDPNVLVAPTVALQNLEPGPLGTFSANEDFEVTITYNPEILDNAAEMVATFAHELSHYLTATAPEPPPGGWENWEFATDICATFLGFGIFMANYAFQFRQFSDVDSQGWSVSGSGYLTQAERSYALAIFIGLKNLEPDSAYRYCDENVRSYLKRAKAELEASAVIGELRKIDYVNPDAFDENR